MAAERQLDELEARLDLKFRRRELLREAMTHTSWINERGAEGRDNERLEYLGDAVLELVAAEYLFNRFPNYDEGQLTQMRSSLVSTVALAGIGEQLGLGEALRLGRGATKSGARRLTSLHANAFEAIIGAAFLDQGYRKAGRIFLSRIADLSSWTDPNFKGRMQALAQERFATPPIYRTVLDGNTRPRQYLSQVSVEGGPVLGEGRGGTKQAAEQGAARAAIDKLVAPTSTKRRRRSRSGAATAPVSAEQEVVMLPTAVAADLPLTAAPGPEPEQVASPPAAAATGTPPARRRRRRSRGSGIGAAAVPPPQIPLAAAEAEVQVALPEPTAVAEPKPARRRRRRSRSAGGPDAAAAASAAPSSSEPVPVMLPAVAELSPVSGPDEPTDASQRKRTHRGRRGGRRRSGRTVTPSP
ncbi:MAG TPA: ribonuclease III [Candidatus Saccharimonadales bacterium]|nr:ribonuclease III [Candidatus Saccharimonadales bacterium]